jgi:hypothetical protein
MLLAAAQVSARAVDFASDDFRTFHKLILPSADDSQWMNVSWQPATDIWAARQKAAEEGKPILLWYMAGEPLGPC